MFAKNYNTTVSEMFIENNGTFRAVINNEAIVAEQGNATDTLRNGGNLQAAIFETVLNGCFVEERPDAIDHNKIATVGGFQFLAAHGQIYVNLHTAGQRMGV